MVLTACVFFFRLLQKRENELRCRREHVERLLNWHQRLDIEEREVLEMEQLIMMFSATDAYTTASSQEKFDDVLAITATDHHQQHHQVEQHINTSASSLAAKIRQHSHRHKTHNREQLTYSEQAFMEAKQQRHLQKIDRSLKTLQNISTKSLSSENDGINEMTEESVQVVGHQLNKLWKRLTGQWEEKFISKEVYKLSKFDLEKLYEEAKMIVLEKFHSDNEIKKLMNSTSNITDIESKEDTLKTNPLENVESVETVIKLDEKVPIKETAEKKDIEIPLLELQSSPDTTPNESREQDQHENNSNHNRMDYYFTNSSSPNEEAVESIKEEKSKDPSFTKELTENEATIVEESVKSEYASTIADDVISTDQTYIKQAIDERNSIHEELSQSTADVESDGLISDITEDSLNHPKLTQSDIPTMVTSKISSSNATEEKIDTISEEPLKEHIQTASDKTQTAEINETAEISSSENNTQLIEDISFPHIDVTTFIGGNEHTDVPNKSETQITDSDEKYLSDDFERSKDSENNFSSSNDSSQKNKSDSEIVTEISSVANPKNQPQVSEYDHVVNSQSSLSRSSSRSPTLSNEVKSKELEQRLIEIDDSLKDLNNTLSRSPVLDANSFGEGSSDSEKNRSIEYEHELSSTSHKEEPSFNSEEQHEEDENKENLNRKRLTVEKAATVPNAGNIVGPLKIDAKIRAKNINENFPLNEIYLKVDGDLPADVASKYSNSSYMRDFPKTSVAIDYNKMPEAEVLKRSQVTAESEVLLVYLEINLQKKKILIFSFNSR